MTIEPRVALGQGANVALLDSISLARALLRSFVRKGPGPSDGVSKNLEQDLLEYENSMLQRCAVKVKASADAAKFLHTNIAISAGNCTRGGAAKAACASTDIL
jgi:2-polyprenyl-6-methoxyphenol hydroxylase-like FAD-dependent oxidoreductase